MMVKRRVKQLMNERYIKNARIVRVVRKAGYTIPFNEYYNQLECFLDGIVYGCALNDSISWDEYCNIRAYKRFLLDRFETRFPEC